jgi:NitT/TauT family transport system permease protein
MSDIGALDALRTQRAITETVAALATADAETPEGKWKGTGTNIAAAAGVFVLFIGTWRLLILAFHIPSYLLPTPWQVVQSIGRDHTKLAEAFWITGREAGGGLVGSVAAGLAGAVIFAQWRWVRRLFYPYTLLLQTVPILAIAPLILTWFGNGPRQVMLIAMIICVFPVLANATQGLISVERNLLDLFAMHNASRFQVLWRLKLPHALPSVFTGIRIASGLSVIGAITGELFAGTSDVGVGGLGYSITYANSQMQTDYMFALVCMSSALGFLFFFTAVFLEWLFLHKWHESALPTHE